MKKIAIVGKGDKRMFAYPLMNVCKEAAKTCVITDDVSYKRLYSGYDNTEQISDRMEINIVDVMSDTPEQEKIKKLETLVSEKEREDFNLILFIFDGYIPEGCDKVLGILTQTKTFLGWSLDFFHDQNKEVVFAMMSMYRTEHSKEVKVHVLPWKYRHMLYLSRVEEFKILHGIKDKKLNELLANAFHEDLEMSKESFLKLATAKKSLL